VAADLIEAVKVTDSKLAEETDKDKKEMYSKMLEKVRAGLEKYSVSKEKDATALIEEATDVLSTWLDKNKGHTITDNSIFARLPRHFEGEFHKDMADLNVSLFFFVI
jgi:cysteinyl-tRNA synthetase